jgi:hypothetical protein
MLATAAVAALAAGLPGPGQLPTSLAALLALPLALGGLGGALVSVLGGQVNVSGGWSLAPPEAQGMRLAFRTVWPPGIAALGAAPVLLARSAVDEGREALAGAQAGVLGIALLFGGVCAWVRVRDDISAWFKSSMEMAQQQQKQRSTASEDDAP